MFSDVQKLQTHVKDRCPEGLKRKAEHDHDEQPTSKAPRLDWISDVGSDTDTEDMSDDDFTDDVMEYFEPIAQEASAKTETTWEGKCDQYQTEGCSDKMARRKAYAFVFEDDKKEFMRIYEKFLQKTIQLEDSLPHQKIVSDIQHSKSENKVKVIKRVLKKYNHWFDDIISNGEIDSQSESSDEEHG